MKRMTKEEYAEQFRTATRPAREWAGTPRGRQRIGIDRYATWRRGVASSRKFKAAQCAKEIASMSDAARNVLTAVAHAGRRGLSQVGIARACYLEWWDKPRVSNGHVIRLVHLRLIRRNARGWWIATPEGRRVSGVAPKRVRTPHGAALPSGQTDLVTAHLFDCHDDGGATAHNVAAALGWNADMAFTALHQLARQGVVVQTPEEMWKLR